MKHDNKAMRIRLWSVITALFMALAAAPGAWAQTADTGRQITLSAKTQTRQQTINDVQAQTGYKFLFNSRLLDARGTVAYGKSQLPLGALLGRMVENTGLSYTIDGRHIIIYSDHTDVAGGSVVSFTSQRVIAGTVTDSAGEPLDGVRVELMDQAGKNVKTNAAGGFRITGVPSGSYIAKLTSADGASVRYREIVVAPEKDASVRLTLSDEVLTGAPAPAETDSAAAYKPAKTTTYFVPNDSDNTIRAYSDEAKTDMLYIPARDLHKGYMPRAAVKTNLLWLATASPNLALELGLAKKWTLDVSAVYNPFKLQKGGINRFGLVQPEVRYWFCQRFEKHFIGLHGLYGRFNIGQVDFLTRTFETNRYKGWGAGAGVSYGYHLAMSRRWSWEFTVGVGYVYLEYDQFRCYECDELVGNKSRHYFGPTKAGVSLVFMIK